MINGILIYDEEGYLRNKSYADSYTEKAAEFNMSVKLLLTKDFSYGIKNNSPYFSFEKPDFAIVRTINPFLSKVLEMAGIRLFNPAFVSEIANNKAAATAYLSSKGIPVPESFFDHIPAGQRSFPLIMKSVDGHGGSEVFWISDDREYEETKNRLSGRQVIIQKPVETLGKDLRVYVLGKKIIAGIMRQSSTSFKSNYSLGGSAVLHELTPEERSLAEKIINLFDFGLVGIDFIYNGDTPVFNEIEDVVGARMLYANMDIDLVSVYLSFIKKSLEKAD